MSHTDTSTYKSTHLHIYTSCPDTVYDLKKKKIFVVGEQHGSLPIGRGTRVVVLLRRIFFFFKYYSQHSSFVHVIQQTFTYFSNYSNEREKKIEISSFAYTPYTCSALSHTHTHTQQKYTKMTQFNSITQTHTIYIGFRRTRRSFDV